MSVATAEIDVRIDVLPQSGDAVLLRFRRMDSGARRDFVVNGVTQRLDAIRKGMSAKLKPLTEVLGQEGEVSLSSEDADRARDRLERLAWSLMGWLFRDACIVDTPPRPVQAQTFVREISELLFGVPVTVGKPWQRPFMIEVCTSGDSALAWHLPIELIPLMPPASVASSADGRSREDFFNVLGMAAIVTRRRRAIETEGTSARRKSPLTVVSAFSDEVDERLLDGVVLQQAYFKQRRSRFTRDKEGPLWPWDREIDVDEAPVELAKILRRVQTAAKATGPRPVVHFCCHYGLASGVPALGLSESLSVSVADLGGEMVRPPHPEFPPEQAHRPLVFLNACDSAAGERGDETLLDLLFHQGFRHVIGAETMLPELVAGEFACAFYEFALGGDPVGTALWRARHHFRKKHGSPAGLLYTFYGSPEIRVG